MNARSWSLGGARRLPTIVLVARREVRMRLRSRVFVGGTIVMAVLVVVGIVAASLLAGKTTPGAGGLQRRVAGARADVHRDRPRPWVRT